LFLIFVCSGLRMGSMRWGGVLDVEQQRQILRREDGRQD